MRRLDSLGVSSAAQAGRGGPSQVMHAGQQVRGQTRPRFHSGEVCPPPAASGPPLAYRPAGLLQTGRTGVVESWETAQAQRKAARRVPGKGGPVPVVPFSICTDIGHHRTTGNLSTTQCRISHRQPRPPSALAVSVKVGIQFLYILSRLASLHHPYSLLHYTQQPQTLIHNVPRPPHPPLLPARHLEPRALISPVCC